MQYYSYEKGGEKGVCRLLRKYVGETSRRFIEFAKDQVSKDRFKEMVVEEHNFHNEDGDEEFAEELRKRREQLEVKTGKNDLPQK